MAVTKQVRDALAVKAIKVRVYDNSVRCKCGSGNYCHRHRAYNVPRWKQESVFEPHVFRYHGND